MTKKKVAKAEEVRIPIKWHVPENIISRYATNMTVQLLENEFKLSFFELAPDIRLDPKQLPRKEVQANCVGNIIINASKLPSIIEVLKQQLELYIAQNKPNVK